VADDVSVCVALCCHDGGANLATLVDRKVEKEAYFRRTERTLPVKRFTGSIRFFLLFILLREVCLAYLRLMV
jgi:hypothetical protein